MRIAIVSDIHGNRTAFEAVLADLKHTAPDQILFGGDLADSGSDPTYIVDRIRDLGWQGVVGNTDEMLFDPSSLTEFAKQMPAELQPIFTALGEMAVATREALGKERLAWLSGLPRRHVQGPMTLLHASPASMWKAPAPDATDAEVEQAYGPLGQSLVVYGHIHVPYIRSVSNMIVANTGSVSLPYDGDPSASYLLLDDFKPATRRVQYDLNKELKALSNSGLPHADWIARVLKSGSPEAP